MIEEQGLATCLDTALLFAAAIELAGLYPVLVFTKGHALAGVWLQPQTLPSLTVEDPIEIRKAIAHEELVLFETTMATGGHSLPFSRAIAEGNQQISEAHEDAFIYALDIRQARGRDIQPLSNRAEPVVGPLAGVAGPGLAPPLDDAPELPPSTPTPVGLSRRGHRPRPSGSIAGSGACSISQSTTGCSISNRQQPRFRSSVPTRRCSRTKSPKTRRSP
jgi:hypothetical protein